MRLRDGSDPGAQSSRATNPIAKATGEMWPVTMEANASRTSVMRCACALARSAVSGISNAGKTKIAATATSASSAAICRMERRSLIYIVVRYSLGLFYHLGRGYNSVDAVQQVWVCLARHPRDHARLVQPEADAP